MSRTIGWSTSSQKTAQHSIDPCPTFNCHLPVFAYGTPQSLDEEMKEIRELEFGRELDFFKGKGAVPEGGPVLFKKETTAYKTKVGTAVSTLFVAKSLHCAAETRTRSSYTHSTRGRSSTPSFLQNQ